MSRIGLTIAAPELKMPDVAMDSHAIATLAITRAARANMRHGQNRKNRGDASDVDRNAPAAEDRPAGIARFAADIELLAERLQPTNVRLTLFQFDFGGLTTGQARSIMRDVAGNLSLWHQAGSTRFVMLTVGEPPRGDDHPLARLATNLRSVRAEPCLEAAQAWVRQLRCNSHDVVNGFYLVDELASQSANSAIDG
jgi:hypothetical protein